MKALVLSGGSGTRLKPLTLNRSKQLLPVVNRPLLHHVLDNIASTGIEDVVIVTGVNHQEIYDSVGDGSLWKLHLSYVCQEKPLGLAHAVQVAKRNLEDEDFLMYLGDNILPDGIDEYLSFFKESKPDALVLLHPVRNPQNFGIAVLSGDRVVRLVEKPQQPSGNLGLVGIYFFTPIIHEAIAAIKPSIRNELEITDAIQHLLESGQRVEARIVKGVWHDAGKPEDLLEANHTFLQRLTPIFLGESIDSSLVGPIASGKGTLIKNSHIIGPVMIGENCIIESSFIGPFTSIGDKCMIRSSGIEYTVLLPQCQLSDIPLISHSILGTESRIIQNSSVEPGFHLITGDHSSLILTGGRKVEPKALG